MINIEPLLEHMIPRPEQCREAAEVLRSRSPGEAEVDLVRHAIRLAQYRGAAAGAATGAASSPLTMVPAALTDMAAMLRIEAVLAGTIGALLDPASALDPHALRADVIGIVFPGAVSQALRQMGIQVGERLSRGVIRKYLGEDLLRLVGRFATRVVGKEVTRDAVLTKTVPLVGIGIGAGWNWLEIRAVGARAVRYYQRA